MIDSRFDKMEARLDKMEHQLGTVDTRAESKIDGISRRIDDEIDQRTQLAERVTKLEEHANA